MINMEKVIKGLACCQHSSKSCCYECPYDGLFNADYFCCTADLASDVLILLREQESRVLTVDEVRRIGANNYSTLKSDCLTVLWLQEPAKKRFPLHVVLLKFDEEDFYGEPNNNVDVYYFGTDEYDQFSLADYGKTWLCWTTKPTEEQRKAVKWND